MEDMFIIIMLFNKYTNTQIQSIFIYKKKEDVVMLSITLHHRVGVYEVIDVFIDFINLDIRRVPIFDVE